MLLSWITIPVTVCTSEVGLCSSIISFTVCTNGDGFMQLCYMLYTVCMGGGGLMQLLYVLYAMCMGGAGFMQLHYSYVVYCVHRWRGMGLYSCVICSISVCMVANGFR